MNGSLVIKPHSPSWRTWALPIPSYLIATDWVGWCNWQIASTDWASTIWIIILNYSPYFWWAQNRWQLGETNNYKQVPYNFQSVTVDKPPVKKFHRFTDVPLLSVISHPDRLGTFFESYRTKQIPVQQLWQFSFSYNELQVVIVFLLSTKGFSMPS